MSLTGKMLSKNEKRLMCIILLNLLMFITNLQSCNQGIEKAIKSGDRDLNVLSTSIKMTDTINQQQGSTYADVDTSVKIPD